MEGDEAFLRAYQIDLQGSIGGGCGGESANPPSRPIEKMNRAGAGRKRGRGGEVEGSSEAASGFQQGERHGGIEAEMGGRQTERDRRKDQRAISGRNRPNSPSFVVGIFLFTNLLHKSYDSFLHKSSSQIL
jgi:hypothetical protein